MLSIIIPVLNEAETITRCLRPLQKLRRAGHEVIVVDGNSRDNTAALAGPLCDKVLSSPPGRAVQMNTGAGQAAGAYLLFLHADTFLPADIGPLIALARKNQRAWGRFDIHLSGRALGFRVIETCINLRSRLSGIATGDQALFIQRALFNEIGGYPELALMEDIAISKILKKISRPICLPAKVESSSRRWEQHGLIKTILTMWLLRALYFCGCDPARLARYYQCR